jgi:ketosteroid isomerase-like protein
MTTAANKELVLSFFDRLSAGKLDGALDLMADTATWWVAGDPNQFALAGDYSKTQFAELLGVVGAALPHGAEVTVTGLLAKGDRVAVEAELHGVSAASRPYHHQFHYIFEVHDGRIQAGREYLDTIRAKEVLLDQRPDPRVPAHGVAR